MRSPSPKCRELSKRRERTCESVHVSFGASIHGYSTGSSDRRRPLSPAFEAASHHADLPTSQPALVGLRDFSVSGERATGKKKKKSFFGSRVGKTGPVFSSPSLEEARGILHQSKIVCHSSGGIVSHSYTKKFKHPIRVPLRRAISILFEMLKL